jgi:hypothetical protein
VPLTVRRLRRGVGALLASLALAAAPAAPAQPERPDAVAVPWDDVPAFEMKGGLAAFWDVAGGKFSALHANAAYGRGFKPITLLNTYVDYPGNQKENVSKALSNPPNPWARPPFFERTVRRNIDQKPANGPYVQDIEIPFLPAGRAWPNPTLRRASGAADEDAFAKAYARAWTGWYVQPLQWTKARYPGTPVGLYGLQPFQRDFWGFVGKTRAQLDQAHAFDLELWRQVDPFVDFYTVSIYAFYDRPETVLFFAANVEENYRRTRQFGNKPVYAYAWLRFHDLNRQLKDRELTPYLAEAMAIVPYFSGARGVALWGWEPQMTADGPPYESLPLFTRSLARVAALSDRIGAGRLVIDKPALELWNARKPLVRRIETGTGACVVMAIDPWQADDDESRAQVSCGGRAYAVPMRGKHTTLIELRPDGTTEY